MFHSGLNLCSPERGFFMFTGIITYLGKLDKREKSLYTFKSSDSLVKKIGPGDSVAVNGVCLTVAGQKSKDTFSVELMPETLRKTMFCKLKVNDLVNLELPVKPSSMLSGHIVQGHIDGVGIIKKITPDKNSRLLTIAIPSRLAKYMVEKGSITVNGISLTVISADKSHFTVGIIPYTWRNTMLKQAKIGDLVNIEVDILAKYLEKLLRKTSPK